MITNAAPKSEIVPLVKGGAGVVLLGVVLALVHPSRKLPGTWDFVSDVMGVTYTLAWSYSFYPQFVLNLRRRCAPLPRCVIVTCAGHSRRWRTCHTWWD
jgi:PQ loop repeat